jgi:hypothetical protein
MNDLAEVEPEVFMRMPSLTSLNLRQNALRHLPSTLGALKSLVSLNVGCNRLSYLPSSLGYCKQLRVLMADNNRMEAVPRGGWSSPCPPTHSPLFPHSCKHTCTHTHRGLPGHMLYLL